MRALLWLDVGANAVDGHVVQGHIVQAERTAAALAAEGVQAVVTGDERQELRGFDVVHSFGARRELLRSARQAGIPVATSAIFWPRSYMLGEDVRERGMGRARTLASRRARVAGSVLRRGPLETAHRLLAPVVERALIFECSDLLLPNAHGEALAIQRELGMTTPIRVVPNGVDPAVFYPPSSPSTRDYVLCVGRIEPHKNQLGLIRAMRRSDIPLVLVGPPHPHHQEYYEECRQVAGRGVRFEQARSHEELRALYQGARVHVLPSWFETTGLVSLEAALAGCNVVSTDRGYASEYLADLADYLDPSDPRSIARAIERAWCRKLSERLRERVLANYTWATVARLTAQAYATLVDNEKAE